MADVKPIQPLKLNKKCAVAGCTNNVAEGNFFLCRFHFMHNDGEMDHTGVPNSERVHKRNAAL